MVNEVAKRNARALTATAGYTAWPGAAALLTLLVLAALILRPSAVHATTYKWVDDKGVVHYTDKLPPEAINKGNVEFNKQGIPVKKNDPALTPEQRRAQEAEEELARQAARVRVDVARKDRRSCKLTRPKARSTSREPAHCPRSRDRCNHRRRIPRRSARRSRNLRRALLRSATSRRPRRSTANSQTSTTNWPSRRT